MQIQNGTWLHIIHKDGQNSMTFGSLVDAIRGGLQMEETQVFTDADEASQAEQARCRRAALDRVPVADILRATKLVLFDEDGDVVQEHSFNRAG